MKSKEALERQLVAHCFTFRQLVFWQNPFFDVPKHCPNNKFNLCMKPTVSDLYL